MFVFRDGCCDDPTATAKLIDALAMLDPGLQPVRKETVDAVAGKVEYRLGALTSFKVGDVFAGSLFICSIQRGETCRRISKAIAEGALPAPADLLPTRQKK